MKKLLWAVPVALCLAAIGCGPGKAIRDVQVKETTPAPEAAPPQPLPKDSGKEDPEQKEKAELKQQIAELKAKLAQVESEHNKADKEYRAAEESLRKARQEEFGAIKGPSMRVVDGRIVNDRRERFDEARNAVILLQAKANKWHDQIDNIQLEMNTLIADIRLAEEKLSQLNAVRMK
jgi:chromosome segregation ATPase